MIFKAVLRSGKRIGESSHAEITHLTTVSHSEDLNMLTLNILLTLFFGAHSWYSVFTSICYIFGFWKLFPKSGLDRRWALVPCAREYMFARCADREVEGRGYSVMRFIEILCSVFVLLAGNLRRPRIFTVFMIVAQVTIFILRIKICSGMITTYGVRRRWMIAWLFLPGLTALYWGFSNKFQPLWKAPDIQDDSLSVFSGVVADEMEQGLTVNIEERHTIDFFRKKYLLRDIHMYIKPGRMVLLLGGSGAGKTTLLNAINGYEKAKAKVMLNGSDVYEDYKKMLYTVGYVPQQETMRGKDTVQQTLTDYALLRLPSDLRGSVLKDRVEEVMKILGISHARKTLVDHLSGGQKKRLSIAMELLSNPSLFILDEPDSGLDGVMARELMNKLREIADQGKIVIVITHTPDRVIDLFDDVIVLVKDGNRCGRLAFYGSIEDARVFFGKEKMEEIIKSVNRVEEGGEGKADYYIEKFVQLQSA